MAVAGGRDTAVVESSGDGDKRDAGVEHLGGHEVTEVMEAERRPALVDGWKGVMVEIRVARAMR